MERAECYCIPRFPCPTAYPGASQFVPELPKNPRKRQHPMGTGVFLSFRPGSTRVNPAKPGVLRGATVPPENTQGMGSWGGADMLGPAHGSCYGKLRRWLDAWFIEKTF